MSTAAAINLIQHMSRQEGSTESSEAVIPEKESHRAESLGVLANPSVPSPQHCWVSDCYWALTPERSVLRITALAKLWMRWKLDDTQQTCPEETINNQVEVTLNEKPLFLVLIKLYTPLLPPTPRKWSSRESLIKPKNLLEILLIKIFRTLWLLINIYRTNWSSDFSIPGGTY